MAQTTETMDQAACPVEHNPAGDSTGVKAMVDREGKYLTFTLDEEEYGIDPYNTGRFDRSQSWNLRTKK